LERRLRLSGIKGFKPLADFDWTWPARVEREVLERALTLDFLQEGRNLVLVGRNGLGKTMIAQNICHAAVLAGHSVLFRSAPALLEDLHRQSSEGRRRKLRGYANVGLLCIDEAGYEWNEVFPNAACIATLLDPVAVRLPAVPRLALLARGNRFQRERPRRPSVERRPLFNMPAVRRDTLAWTNGMSRCRPCRMAAFFRCS
jgi:hypothetical protein